MFKFPEIWAITSMVGGCPESFRKGGVQMRSSEILQEETQSIERMLNVLDRMCRRMERGENIDPKHLRKTLNFFKIFVDQCHNSKEENLLFPRLVQAGMTEQECGLEIMTKENALCRNIMLKMDAAIKRYQEGDPDASSEIASLARDYLELETKRLELETTRVIPMAKKYLSDDIQLKIADEFTLMEDLKFGVGKHGNFHKAMNQIIQNMCDIYVMDTMKN